MQLSGGYPGPRKQRINGNDANSKEIKAFLPSERSDNDYLGVSGGGRTEQTVAPHLNFNSSPRSGDCSAAVA